MYKILQLIVRIIIGLGMYGGYLTRGLGSTFLATISSLGGHIPIYGGRCPQGTARKLATAACYNQFKYFIPKDLHLYLRHIYPLPKIFPKSPPLSQPPTPSNLLVANMELFRLVFVLLASILCPVLSVAVRSEVGQESWDLSTSLNGFSFERAEALSTKSTESIGIHVSRLKNLKIKSDTHPRSSLSLLTRPDQPHEKGIPHQNITAVGTFSTAYAIQCTWDQTPVWLIFDTGSSDTWAAKTGFRCENSVGNKRDQAACNFGQPHIKGFLQDISEVYFHRRYGSGEDVSGPMGTSDIACGGVSVSGQQVGLASRAYWHGNNVTVGILGLAYPSLTSGHIGDPGDPVDDSEWNNYPYTPWLSNAISQGLIDPVFSVTIDRNTSDGVLAWGGLPPMHWHPKSFASTDLIIVSWLGLATCFLSFGSANRLIGKTRRPGSHSLETLILHHHSRWPTMGKHYGHGKVSLHRRYRHYNDACSSSLVKPCATYQTLLLTTP
jgi:hypothetical protein